MIRVAWVGRTSTYDQQDPTLSLPRQLRVCQSALPDRAVIVAWFYDIESGRKDLAERGRGHAHELFQIPIPRDGGIQDLLEEAERPDRRFDVVICEDISRIGRRTYISTEIEHRLEQAGVTLVAADEPIRLDTEGRRAKTSTQVLTRRVKQGVAEWYVTQMLELSWDGFETHTQQGFNIGKPCYGYRAKKVKHPVPAKRAKGIKKTLLVVHEVEGPVVSKMYRWRVDERLAYQSIADRLNEDLVFNPPPTPIDPARAVGMWTYSNVREILTNPKYTGHMVWNRRARKGNGRNRINSVTKWVWSAQPVHDELVDLETFVQAQMVSEHRERSRSAPGKKKDPQAKRVYRLRSYLFHDGCGRRMTGNTMKGNPYYACAPKKAWRPANHPSICRVREDSLLEQLADFLSTRVFGPYRHELLDANIKTLDDASRRTREERITALRRAIADTHTKSKNLIRSLEVADEVNEELVRDINERRAELKKERAHLEDQLADLEDEVQHECNPDLLHRLPISQINLAELPDQLTRQLFEALRLEIHYNHETRIATCRVTLIGETVVAVGNTAREATMIPFPNRNGTIDEEDNTMTNQRALQVDGLCGAPGAIRTASARNRQRRELVVSATVEVARRHRRSGGEAR